MPEIDGNAGQSGINPDRKRGVWGDSDSGYGVVGTSDVSTGVAGTSNTGIGVQATGSPAGRFNGDVEITGDIRLTNADCAEDFDISVNHHFVEPGTVMILGEEGALEPSHYAYDKKVAGVISGAGGYKPGIILDRQELFQTNRMPLVLVGKAHCKVDANYSPIEIGDLLTTSPTPGYAMKAADPVMAFGAVIGKALRPLKTGKRLIPILIALQ